MGSAVNREMKKAIAIACACCISVGAMLTGCGKVSPAPNGQEVEFLKDQYWGGTRLENGVLFSFEENALDAYRDTLTYLESKYPNRGFTIVDAKINKFNRGKNEFFIRDTKTGKVKSNSASSVIVVTDKGSESITDNYWGFAIRDKYEKALLSSLQSIDPRIKAVDVTFNTYTGEDVKPSVDSILAGQIPLDVEFVIYMNDETVKKQYKTTAGRISTYMKNHQLTGRCLVYAFGSDKDLKDAVQNGTTSTAIYYDYFTNS